MMATTMMPAIESASHYCATSDYSEGDWQPWDLETSHGSPITEEFGPRLLRYFAFHILNSPLGYDLPFTPSLPPVLGRKLS
jgi:hypothetical protein